MIRTLLSIPSMKNSLWSSSSWSEEINKSQDGIFFTLCGFYALVSAIALIQLIRIEIRLPEYGWTIQKVFHLMNFIARNLPTDTLKATYTRVNVGVYVIQACVWIYRWLDDRSMVHFVGKLFLAVVSFMAALGFLLYGVRLFFMLRRYPVESEGKRRKLHEVGSVATICFTFFVVRYFVDVLSAFDSEVSLDVLGRPVLNLIFYMLAEVLPSALVLFILRKLPPKRASA
ncbi:hypothetical protein M8C21_032064 [Ambrosia artemisiifolia]|uniref:THH1/TOM1/TOM3 domain-containing protein n=1 Tax=Ambrosia artemisiifolia TaxID=4212 RepID=A0AAD5GRV1_AMBAR|nr:hypothetical protein M8C21_032064 [Ambrosia artemisiifolia]